MVLDAPAEYQTVGFDKLLKWRRTLADPTPLYDVLEETKENPRTLHYYMERTKSLATSKLFPETMRLVYG